ncbi:hypothetical protein [Methylobacterium sp. JK268]
MLHRIALALALSSTAALAAPQQTPVPDRALLKQHCTGDYLTYCGDLPPDGPEVQACFRQNKAKLSQNCQSAIASYVKAQRRG